MKHKSALLLLLIVAMLTACSDKTPTPTATAPATSTPSPTSQPTNTPTPTETPEPEKLSDVYTNSIRSDIYRIDIPDFDPSFSIDEGHIRDGYVLLRLRDADSVVIRLALFPVLHPELVKYFDVEDYLCNYIPADGGNVLELNPVNGSLNVYSKDFECISRYPAGTGNFFACDKFCRCWYTTEDGYLGYINPFTSDKQLYTSSNFRRVDRILQESEGSIWFLATGGPMISFPVCLNISTGEFKEADGFSTFPTMCGQLATYYSPNYWYYSFISDFSTIYSFEKNDDFDSFWDCNNENALAVHYLSDYVDDTFIYDENFSVFNLQNGGLVSSVTTDLFDTSTSLTILSLMDDNTVLFTSSKDNLSTLYLWDFSGVKAEASPSFYSFTNESIDSEIEKKATALKDKYFINLYYDCDRLTFLSDDTGYLLFEPAEKITLMNSLDSLAKIMAQYPENFFNEVLGNTWNSFDIYLSDGISATSTNMYPYPSAFVTNRNNCIIMCINLSALQSGGDTNFAHEIMHVMEYRINEYCVSVHKAVMGYWDEHLVPAEYPYFFSTVDADGVPFDDPTSTVLSGDPDPWFIDTYARSNEKEDRARVIEYMLIGNAEYFRGQHLRNKALFLTAVIREVFPSFKAAEEPILWEKLLGIDGPKLSDYEFRTIYGAE